MPPGRRVEAVERGLEAGEVLLESRNGLFRRYARITDVKTKYLLAQLAEPIDWTDGAKTIYVEISRFLEHGRHKQLGNRFGPACQIHQDIRFLCCLRRRLLSREHLQPRAHQFQSRGSGLPDQAR